MNRLIFTFTALILGPLLSGCCCCSQSYCGGASYSGCLNYQDSYSTGSECCQGSRTDGFSLPPAPNSGSYPAMGTPYGAYYGSEFVGPEFVPAEGDWQVAPAVPGSPSPVTPAPAPPPSSAGPSALMPPMPVPAISTGSNSNGIPSPAPYAASSAPMVTDGPMMPQVPPPPPEPISQMRFRQYR